MIVKICDKCGDGYRASEEHICKKKNHYPLFSKDNIEKYLEEKEREANAKTIN